jgi:hypothetical protein
MGIRNVFDATTDRKAAKKRGLSEKLLQYQERRKQQKMEAAMMEGAGTSKAPASKGKSKGSAKRGRKKKTE